MRSQVFGFAVNTKYVFELILPCSLFKARDTLVQHMRRLGAGWQVEKQLFTFMGDPDYMGMDVIFNQWGEEVEEIIRSIVQQHSIGFEPKRIEALREGLAWRYTNIRRTMTSAQFFLAHTVEGQTHMTVFIGWNDDASESDRSLIDMFMEIYLHYLKDLGLTTEDPRVGVTKQPVNNPRVRYGPRLDTLDKLEKLRQLRDEHKRQHGQIPVRNHLCQLVGITPTIVKKHRSELYDRWYDMDY